jgi:hypothetical protein
LSSQIFSTCPLNPTTMNSLRDFTRISLHVSLRFVGSGSLRFFTPLGFGNLISQTKTPLQSSQSSRSIDKCLCGNQWLTALQLFKLRVFKHFDLRLPVITLNCTRHTYLVSGHLRLLLFQNTTEQLFLKNPFIKPHAPCSITESVYTLDTPIQPACTYKSTKKGNFLTEHTTLGKLTNLLAMHG